MGSRSTGSSTPDAMTVTILLLGESAFEEAGVYRQRPDPDFPHTEGLRRQPWTTSSVHSSPGNSVAMDNGFLNRYGPQQELRRRAGGQRRLLLHRTAGGIRAARAQWRGQDDHDQDALPPCWRPDAGDVVIGTHSVLREADEVRKIIGVCPQELAPLRGAFGQGQPGLLLGAWPGSAPGRRRTLRRRTWSSSGCWTGRRTPCRSSPAA